MFKINILHCILLFSYMVFPQEWQSKYVYYDSNNKLKYHRDSLKNMIPDFSFAGYKNGEADYPKVPVVKTLNPVAGDNTSYLQSAINEVGAMPADSNGIRGAILLKAGVYHIWGSLKINFSGVVLRGVGRGTDSTKNTIIYGRGNDPAQRQLIVAGGGSGTDLWRDSVAGTKTNIISDSVLVGENEFLVADPRGFKIGDNIIIYHPCTQKWLEAVDFGATASDNPWTLNEQPIIFNRYIKKIMGNRITVDVPLFNHLIKGLSQSYVYKFSGKNIKKMIGIENLCVDIETTGGTDENHIWDAVLFYQAEDCWAKNCAVYHYGLAGFETGTATRITIDSCNSLDPISIIDGGRRYNFSVYVGSQQILFKNCWARNGRHHFVSNGTSSTSGVVFYNCISEKIYSSSEGHRRWSQGLLYDNIKEISPNTTAVLGLYNRGDYGTGHGWASVHSVAWNYNALTKNIYIQKPPTGQNYAIGCFAGKITGQSPPAPFNQPEGYIEGMNKSGLKPSSLYLAQFIDRTTPVKIEREPDINESDFKIYQNYPNPFNPTTTIGFSLKTDNQEKVTVKVFDSLGRQIEILAEQFYKSGEYSFIFDGSKYASGNYYYEIIKGDVREIRKMTLIK